MKVCSRREIYICLMGYGGDSFEATAEAEKVFAQIPLGWGAYYAAQRKVFKLNQDAALKEVLKVFDARQKLPSRWQRVFGQAQAWRQNLLPRLKAWLEQRRKERRLEKVMRG